MGRCTPARCPLAPATRAACPACVLKPKARGVPGSGLMRVPKQPGLSPQHWNPSTRSYLPGQTPSLIAAGPTCQSALLALPASGSSASALYLCRPTPCPAGVTAAVLEPVPHWPVPILVGAPCHPCGAPCLQQAGTPGLPTGRAAAAGATWSSLIGQRLASLGAGAMGLQGRGLGPALRSGHCRKQPSVCLGPGSFGSPYPLCTCPLVSGSGCGLFIGELKAWEGAWLSSVG